MREPVIDRIRVAYMQSLELQKASSNRRPFGRLDKTDTAWPRSEEDPLGLGPRTPPPPWPDENDCPEDELTERLQPSDCRVDLFTVSARDVEVALDASGQWNYFTWEDGRDFKNFDVVPVRLLTKHDRLDKAHVTNRHAGRIRVKK